MSDLPASLFFELEGFQHRALFADDAPVWSALGDRLRAYLEGWTRWDIEIELPAGMHFLGDHIAIAPGCKIEPGAVIVGPAILEHGVTVRTGAYVREHVVLGAGSLVGAHTEVKGSVLFPGARAPHQNYVGDSVLGRDVNLGAGTILSNVKNVGAAVSFPFAGRTIDTGLRKLGAILGDDCRTGCNPVANPGVLMAPGCVTYPGTSLRAGFYPERTLVKLRQVQQQLRLDRLA